MAQAPPGVRAGSVTGLGFPSVMDVGQSGHDGLVACRSIIRYEAPKAEHTATSSSEARISRSPQA